MRHIRPLAASALVITMLLPSCDSGAPNGDASSARRDASTGAAGDSSATEFGITRTEMRDVELVVEAGIVLHIELLQGHLTSRAPGEPVVLDDQESYVLHIDTASTSMAYEDLGRLLNERVFSYDGAPLVKLQVRREDDEDQHDRVEVKGNLRSHLNLPFEIEGVPEVTADGEIRMRTSSLEVSGIGVADLLDAFGSEAEDLISVRRGRGVRIEGDDMVLTPGHMLTPPQTRGTITEVKVGPNELAMTFGSGGATSRSSDAAYPAPSTAPSAERHDRGYIAYRGGRVKLAKITVTDTDLTIVDDDPGDAFRFWPARMDEQFEAGYMKIRSDGGLIMFAPDADQALAADSSSR